MPAEKSGPHLRLWVRATFRSFVHRVYRAHCNAARLSGAISICFLRDRVLKPFCVHIIYCKHISLLIRECAFPLLLRHQHHHHLQLRVQPKKNSNHYCRTNAGATTTVTIVSLIVIVIAVVDTAVVVFIVAVVAMHSFLFVKVFLVTLGKACLVARVRVMHTIGRRQLPSPWPQLEV